MKTNKFYLKEWNDLFTKNVHNDSPHVNEVMADYCEKLLLKAKARYYKGLPIMEDNVYDNIEDKLKILRPNSKVLEKVGG